MSQLCYNIYKFSRKDFRVRNLKLSLAEYSLRGLIAWQRRVMTKWLKTPESVVSRDHLFSEMLDSSRKLVGDVPTNPTTLC